ncbi:LysR family transcriptional regulator [Streptomyces carpaticus]|uniref:LysR family transcriptional regulator n=1 Tax=Streptomyces carpaticus TaxID=285558 RepID=UPI0021FC1B12|nr:LysR family transcriptional regulator [Streptomyces carpaticus]
MPGLQDTDPRLLRAFVAVATELHFTRAAARLFVAQQALSRDIRRLEDRWGVRLFVRSTRQVTLTAEGERLLEPARRAIAAQEELAAAVAGAGAADRPLVVDVGAPASTARRILTAAREAAPGVEFVARFHSGLAGAAAELVTGELDVSFGRFAGLDPQVRAVLAHRPVRYERVAVLLPAGDPLAALAEVPLARLAGRELYAGAGNPETTEWTDFARRLFAGRSIAVAPPFPRIDGEEEFVRLVLARGWTVLASEEFTEVPGMVLRPLTDPVPLSPVSMVSPRTLRHPGLTALTAAATTLATPGDWLHRPPGAWLPEPDRGLLPPADAGREALPGG